MGIPHLQSLINSIPPSIDRTIVYASYEYNTVSTVLYPIP